MQHANTKSGTALPKLQVKFGQVHVATYQLPVGLGDCSVHLLVDKDGTVVSGFLMDGGKDAREVLAAKVIDDGLRLLAAAYGRGWNKLRAWVVTHWDEDHYMGMANWIVNNITGEFFTEEARFYTGPEINKKNRYKDMPSPVADALRLFTETRWMVGYFYF
jgi:glyoxylase-like metal-dependent hydrolase (beta-lactamase superfamily II)